MPYHRTTASNVSSSNRRLLFLDVIELNATKYAVYLPLDSGGVLLCSQDPRNLLVREIEGNEDSTAPCSYVDVDDEEVVSRVLAIYDAQSKVGVNDKAKLGHTEAA